MIHLFVSNWEDAEEVIRQTRALRNSVRIQNDIRRELEEALSKNPFDFNEEVSKLVGNMPESELL